MRPALGKGLNALISEEMVTAVSAAPGAPASKNAANVTTLPISQIQANPKQPRREFDEGAMNDLTDSIKQKGVIQPILVFALEGGKYEIIAGERRWRAAQRAGLQAIPAVIGTGSESERFEMALIENIQREDLNPIEQAEGYRRLQHEFSMTQEQIARVMSKDRAVIANTLRLLHLPENIQVAVSTKKITMGHARALLSIEDPLAREVLFNKIIVEELSVRQVEQAAKIQKPTSKNTPPSAPEKPSIEIKNLQHDLQQQLARKVEFQVSSASAQKGWIRLEFYSLDDLDTLIQQLKGMTQHH